MSADARYLAWFAAALGLLAIVPLLNYVVIVRSGEMTQLPDLVREQQRTGAIYGTGLHDVRGEHPLEIARQRQPEIVVLGSSRAFDMRQEFFTRPFACACGMVDSIEDAEVFAGALMASVRPRLVLLSLDFWWFTTSRPQRAKPLEPDAALQLTRHKLLRPSDWVREGTLAPVEYLRLLGGERELSGATAHPKVGVMAIKRSIGTRADGSQLTGVRLGEGARAFYAEARGVLRDPVAWVMADRNPEHRYGPDKAVSEDRLRALDRLLSQLRATGAQVVLYQPPVAPSIASAMASSGRHGHLEALSQRLRARGEYYDFLDPRTLGVEDTCEFADVHHSGNAMMMRILREIVRRAPGSPVARHVDARWLDEAVSRHAGTTISELGDERLLAAEIDYLDAGCRGGARPAGT